MRRSFNRFCDDVANVAWCLSHAGAMTREEKLELQQDSVHLAGDCALVTVELAESAYIGPVLAALEESDKLYTTYADPATRGNIAGQGTNLFQYFQDVAISLIDAQAALMEDIVHVFHDLDTAGARMRTAFAAAPA